MYLSGTPSTTKLRYPELGGASDIAIDLVMGWVVEEQRLRMEVLNCANRFRKSPNPSYRQSSCVATSGFHM